MQAAEQMGVSVDEVLFLDDNLNADKAATDGYIYDFTELLERGAL